MPHSISFLITNHQATLLFLILLVTSTTSLLPCSSLAAALTDKDILLQSKAQLIGSCTECLPTWIANNSLSEFEGITTTTTSSSPLLSVEKINIPPNPNDYYVGLRGTLPSSWSALSSVTTIDLSQNIYLSDALPPSWALLNRTLSYIDLSGNVFTGSLPEDWSALVKLTYFGVSANFLSGTLPFSYSNWISLKHFDVAQNKMSGLLPPSFKEWKLLKYFGVSKNLLLTGPLPPGYSAFEHVTTFDVASNNFFGELPGSYGAWREIKDFLCNDNRLSGQLPDSYQSWGDSLFQFKITNNQFSGSSLPPSWSAWVNIKMFIARSSGLSGMLPETYETWSQILEFDVSLNQLTGELPSGYKNWTHIGDFYVNSNQLTGILSPEYSAWSRMQWFTVSSNRLTGELPSSYSHWNQTLTTFQVDNNFFEGPIPSSYASLGQMTIFDVSNNKLSGPISSSFGISWQSSLESFLINGNQISGELPVTLSNLTRLTLLDVSNNLLHGTISPELCDLSALSIADFSQNCFEISQETINCFAALPNLLALRYAPSCFSALPALATAPLATSYSYNVVNKLGASAPECQEFIDFSELSYCSSQSPARLRFISTVNGNGKVFQFGVFCRSATGERTSSVPFHTGCYALLFRPLLECFVDIDATIPCSSSTNPIINYPQPSYHNKTVLADVSFTSNEWTLDVSNSKYIYGVYFRIFALASLNIAVNYTTAFGNRGPLYYRSNTTTPMFQADPCQLQSSVAVQYSTDCTVCPDLALCDGTTSIYVSTKEAAWRYSSDLLPFYECDLKTSKGCLKSNNTNNFDGSSCRDHFTGFLCARCESDYAMADGECSQCPSKGSIIGIFCACIVALLIIATLLVYVSLDSVKKEKEEVDKEEDECCDCSALEQKLQQYRPQLEKLTVIVRMLINHFTLLGALASTSAANQATDSLKTLLKIQNGGGGGALLGAYSGTLSCLFSNTNQVSSSVLNFNILWIVFASVFVFESIFFFAFTRKITSTAAVALFLSFVAFSPLAEYSSKLLALCKPFDFYNTRDYLRYGTTANLNQTFSYLSTDLAQECDGQFENSARVGAALTISLFCGLLPVIIAFAYKKIQSADDRAAIFSFMTEDYKKEAWYYELIVMVRKLLIALVISIFVEQGDLQLQLFTLVTTMMLGASLTIQPLQSKIANIVDQVSISSALVCATFLSVISGFADDKGVAIASTVLIFMTQIVAILAIVLFSHRSEEDKNSSPSRYYKEQEVGSLNAPLLFSAKDSELATEQGDDDGEDDRPLSYWKRKAEELENEKRESENERMDWNSEKCKLEKARMESETARLESENRRMQVESELNRQKETARCAHIKLENEIRLLQEKITAIEKKPNDNQ